MKSVKPYIGQQVIPLLNPDVVKGKDRPKGATGKNTLPAGVTMIPWPAVEATAALAAAMRGGRGRGERGRGEELLSSTRGDPSAFKIDPYEFPSSTAPTRV